MNNIQKIERALAFAKEMNLTDDQVRELMAMVLGLINLKLTPATPIVPWVPNTPNWPGIGGPGYPGDTIITYGIAPASAGSLFDGINRLGCACSPVGQPHHDNCKAA